MATVVLTEQAQADFASLPGGIRPRVKIENREYVILPRAEYEALAGIPAGAVDAMTFMTDNIAGLLRSARAHAKLSQEDLAKKIRKSQAMVSSAESGKTKPSERYVALVLKACSLPKDWTGPKGEEPGARLLAKMTGKVPWGK